MWRSLVSALSISSIFLLLALPYSYSFAIVKGYRGGKCQHSSTFVVPSWSSFGLVNSDLSHKMKCVFPVYAAADDELPQETKAKGAKKKSGKDKKKSASTTKVGKRGKKEPTMIMEHQAQQEQEQPFAPSAADLVPSKEESKATSPPSFEIDYQSANDLILEETEGATLTSQDEDELYSLLYSDISGQPDVDYDELERQRREAEEQTYAHYEYYNQTLVDEDGVELMWDPIFGPSNPIDERAIVTPLESYMVAEHTRDETMLTPLFSDDDPEKQFNDQVKQIRLDMKKLETYVDPHLQLEVPRNVKPWYGTVGEESPYEPKEWSNNRFTKAEDKTDFGKLDPYRARKLAVQMARQHNNEWLPEGVSEHRRAKVCLLYWLILLCLWFKKVDVKLTYFELFTCLSTANEILSRV